MTPLEEIATRLQVQLEGLKTNTAQDYSKLLDELGDVLAAEVSAREISEITRREVETIVSRVRDAHASNLDESLARLVDVLRDLAAYSYEFEAGALLTVSTATDVRQPTRIQLLWDKVIERPMGHDGSLLLPYLDQMNEKQVRSAENMIRRAHAEGWSNRQMLQAYRGTRTNRYTDGIQATLGRAAKAAVSTAIQHVNNAARMVTWEDNEDIVQGYRIVATLDARTTDKCRALDGQEFEVGNGPIPPLHIGCRSTTVAVLDKLFDPLRDRLTRSSATGPVPQRMTYYEWLATQSAEFQNKVLGPTRATLFRQGGLSVEEFARLQLNRRFDPITLDEMKRLKPLAFQKAGI